MMNNPFQLMQMLGNLTQNPMRAEIVVEDMPMNPWIIPWDIQGAEK